jgi:hypothetical protein
MQPVVSRLNPIRNLNYACPSRHQQESKLL